MKQRKKAVLLASAVSLAFALVFAGCDFGLGPGPGGSGSDYPPTTKITITGLYAFNGHRVSISFGQVINTRNWRSIGEHKMVSNNYATFSFFYFQVEGNFRISIALSEHPSGDSVSQFFYYTGGFDWSSLGIHYPAPSYCQEPFRALPWRTISSTTQTTINFNQFRNRP